MLRQHYWSNVLNILRQKVGAEVIVTSVPATGSIASRAKTLHGLLKERAPGRSINFMAHSMGGLDCRHLISHIKPAEYTPVSLTTIATPHRGSPFMDWCTVRITFYVIYAWATLFFLYLYLTWRDSCPSRNLTVSSSPSLGLTVPSPHGPGLELVVYLLAS